MNNKRVVFLVWIVFYSLSSFSQYQASTYCNPLNLNYRFTIEPLSYKKHDWGARMPGCDMDKGEYHSFREAADPTVVVFKKEYYLFASKSGGYWVSKDLLKWEFITTSDLPLEAYAPTAIVIEDSMYFATTSSRWIYKTDNPRSGKWDIANLSQPLPVEEWPANFQDLCLFLDDDKKLYLYYGCIRPVLAVELDYNDGFRVKGKLGVVLSPEAKYEWNHMDSIKNREMMIEGPWMTKYNDKYYLQYATFSDSYVDGVIESSNPLSGFKVADSNPFSQKANGFVTGIGHGSTFADNYDNYWHFTCIHAPGIKHGFERRLAMFPSGFDKDGMLYCNSSFGDYPHYIPNKNFENKESLFTGWVLLSYKKPVEASSLMDGFPLVNAVDENLHTYWSASSANKGEWFCVDLKKKCNVYAIQINFAEHLTKVLGRPDYGGFQYLVEYSNDKIEWKTLVDKTQSNDDFSHDYFEIENPTLARYIRITNVRVPDGMFAMYDFRIFGKSNEKTPEPISELIIKRDSTDGKNVKLTWNKVPDVIGYNIRYGIAKDKLYMSRIVYSDTSLIIGDLNRGKKYYFAIDVFNEGGVTRGEKIVEIE